MIYQTFRFLIPDSMSNMAIMRVGAPSGFEAQKEGLLGNPLVKKVETAGGQLIIYFDDVSIHMPIQIRSKNIGKSCILCSAY